MLDVLNRYAHGFVIVPITLACRRRGIFSALQSEPTSADALAEKLHANSGHLQVVLRLLESLGWIDRDSRGRFSGTPALHEQRFIVDELQALVDSNLDAYLQSGSGGLIEPWLKQVRERWGGCTPLMADFLDGMLVVPVLALLKKRDVLRDLVQSDFAVLPDGVRDEVIALLKTLGWVEGSLGSFGLTPPGAFMFERSMNLGVAESYRPMLQAMDRLLFGDAAGVFARGPDGHEGHVDRSMNVISSGFQHDRYFAEVEEILISIFSREPFSEQPRYVADMGSGDGTFLRRVINTVRDKTPRGKVLSEYPLTLIGIDLNQASLDETSRTLGTERHIVITGDIGKPAQIPERLRAAGIDPEQVLHIRSFLDHDRPFIAPVDDAALAARAHARYLGAYSDRAGRAIAPATAVQGLVEHLSRWAAVINRHGLILLEVHCQDPLVVRANIDQSESLYFDALEGFSQQFLVEADAALMAAAEAGLFPRVEYFKKFPSHLPASRITLNMLERQPYRVRLATTADLPALLQLEEACWPERMRTPAAELLRRVTDYALGQWLLELEGSIVGVIYTQRIADFDRLRVCRWQELPELHQNNGSVVQLLGLNVLPAVRRLGLGDRLLDLMLLRSSVQGGVRQVAGITRCRDFRGTTPQDFSAYVHQRDASGQPLDPILQFHHSHGAEFLGVVADFRPEDSDNLGAGVLLRYDLATPGIPAVLATDQTGGTTPAPVDTRSRLESCLRALLGKKRQDAFSWMRPLREMGLDSLDLLGLRAKIQQTFDQVLSPTLFFSHPTLQSMVSLFEGSQPAGGAGPTPGSGSSPDLTASLEEQSSGLTARTAINTTNDAAIAVVGMASRFPGGDGLDGFWEVLQQGSDAVTELPSDRWNKQAFDGGGDRARGKIVTQRGGFLNQIDEFDAAFFNISPREASAMDPQQRLLLEIHWEALEHAAIDAHQLRETACGIFVGLYGHDYELLQNASVDSADLDVYYATGNSAAIAAGRIAYFLGTRGPAITLDTACSSSLVAVHQAIRSLRSRECGLAIASGVNVMLAPQLSVAFSQAGMLSPRGRCATFDAGADGYVRAEGCGAVVLKRLEDAHRDGDTVLAVLRGSAINQDGASNGLTAPSLTAQEQLLRLALADGQLRPSDINYIEAHGTGTSLGDPVEFQALNSIYGNDPLRTEPLWLGSVKTNIGHAEAAAGIAGLIKVVLAMQHEWLPAHLHFERPNPHLDLDGLPARIPVQGRPWRRGETPLRAGVSAFGFSGTNAHVIVEQASRHTSPIAATAGRPAHVLAISAKSAPALKSRVRAYADWLSAHPATTPDTFCRAANVGRAHHEFRAAFIAGSSDGLLQALRRVTDPGVASQASGVAPRVAFLFTGQGSQYVGMAREMAQQEPTFRACLRQCQQILASELDMSLQQILYPADPDSSTIHDTALTQPVLFAVEYSLARMLQSWGIEPAAVMGHSVGEYVAACIAGVFSLEDGLRLIAARGRLMSALPRDGAMLAVLGESPIVTQMLARYEHSLSVAAYNGPENLVVSGAREQIDSLEQQLVASGINTVRLQVSHAFHSPLMDPMLDQFASVAATVHFQAPRLDYISNVTGHRVGQEVADPGYWCRHVRQPVRFTQGIESLHRSGVQFMLEVGPHPVLSSMGQKCLPGKSSQITWLHTLARGTSDWDGVLAAAAALYLGGAEIKWAAILPGKGPRAIGLPTYPWQRRRFWLASRATRLAAPESRPAALKRIHSPALRDNVYETRLGQDSLPLLDSHRIAETVIVPGPVLCQLALSAASGLLQSRVSGLGGMKIHNALLLPDSGERTVQVLISPADEGIARFRIYSADASAAESPQWIMHAGGEIMIDLDQDPAPAFELDAVRDRCPDTLARVEFYSRFAARGVELGEAIRAVVTYASGTNEALSELALPEGAGDGVLASSIHWVLLDAALQTAALLICQNASAEDLVVLSGFDRLRMLHGVPSTLICHAILRPEGLAPTDLSSLPTVDIRLYTGDRQLVAQIDGVRFAIAPGIASESQSQVAKKLLFELHWQPRSGLCHPLRQLAADDLPPLVDLRQRLQEALVRLGTGSVGAARAAAIFDGLAFEYVSRSLQLLGWRPTIDSIWSTGSAMQELGVEQRHERLLGRMLQILADEGFLSRHDAAWRVIRQLPPPRELESVSRLCLRMPEFQAELRLFDRCASKLPEVLSGRCDALQLLFPPDAMSSAASVYDDSAIAQIPNGLMKELVAALITSVPAGRVLRVLEIGAGTGGTTNHLLPMFSTVPCEYVFTDVSKLFLQRAEQKYRRFDCVQYAMLDIEQDPGKQGFAAGQFDLILAANVIHATRNLAEALQHVRALLVPGGMLALIEGIRPARWIDLVFGQTEGWWRFTDFGRRPTHPLLSLEQWQQVLAEVGFADTAAVPAQSQSEASPFEQAVVLGKAPLQATLAIDVPRNPVELHSWLIFGEQSTLSRELTARLSSAGNHVVQIECQDRNELLEAISIALAGAEHRHVHAVILWGASLPAVSNLSKDYEHSVSCCVAALHAMQSLVGADASDVLKLWLVTRGAHSILDARVDARPAPLWGLGRVMAMEYPSQFGGLIDLDTDASEAEDCEAILWQVSRPEGVEQCAFRHGVRFIPQLVASPADRRTAPELALDGCHIVTGGLGGVGLHAAIWLARRGARQILLISRHALPPRDQWDQLAPGDEASEAIARIRDVEQLGAKVVLAAVDIADGLALQNAMRGLRSAGLAAVQGVIHAAAATEDRLIGNLDRDAIAASFRAKVLGALNLEACVAQEPLQYFVCCSSVSALLGQSGQAAYAAANAYLDAFVQRRRNQGHTALAVNWGGWYDTGSALSVGGRLSIQSLEQRGFFGFSPTQGLSALDTLIRQDVSNAAVVRVDAAAIRRARAGGAVPLMLQRLVATGDSLEDAEPRSEEPHQSAVRSQLLELTTREARSEFIERRLIELLAGVLRIETAAIDRTKPLGTFGLDSLMAVELKNRCERSFGLVLSATMVWSYPTVAALTGHMLDRFNASAGPLPANVEEQTPFAAPTSVDTPVSDVLRTVTELSEEGALEALLSKRVP